MQFTIVKAVPLAVAVAFFATIVDNNGESIMTTMPQKIKNTMTIKTEDVDRINGEIKQQKPDKAKATNVVDLADVFSEI